MSGIGSWRAPRVPRSDSSVAAACLTGSVMLYILVSATLAVAQEPTSRFPFREEVQEILDTEYSVRAVESLKILGSEAVPALIEQLYERPEEILAALGALGDTRATYPVLDYLTWALRNRPELVVTGIATLEQLDDSRAVPRLRELLTDPALESSLRLRSAEAVLAIGGGDDTTVARQHLLEIVDDRSLETGWRIYASRILLRDGVEEDVSTARRFLFEVYAGTRMRFEGSQPTTGQPFVTLHTGGATELIAALAEVGDAEADEKLREWLAQYPSNTYEAIDMIDHLLKAPTEADVNAIMLYIEKDLDGGPIFQIGLLERLASKGLVRDGRRLRRILEPVWRRMRSLEAVNDELPPDDELRIRVERLLRIARELERKGPGLPMRP